MSDQVEIQDAQNKVAEAVNTALTNVVGEDAAYAAVVMFQHKDEGANLLTVGSKITDHTAHALVVVSKLLVQALNDSGTLAKLTDMAENGEREATFDA